MGDQRGPAGAPAPTATGLPGNIRACLFDLDGVLTETAAVHAAAWKQMFDEFLRAARSRRTRPSPRRDYDEYVDGKPRDGRHTRRSSPRAASSSRREPTTTPRTRHVQGLGSRKNDLVQEQIERDGVTRLRRLGALRRAARAAGLRTAVVSSSANTDDVLQSPGSGICSRRASTGSSPTRAPPRPASRRRTCSSPARPRVETSASEAAVFEDALAGVAAGRAGGFGLVVGVDRVGQADALRGHGADIVGGDLQTCWWPGAGVHEVPAASVQGQPLHEAATGATGEGAADRTFEFAPWSLREAGLHCDHLARSRSRCSRCPTATSASAATLTRASRTACPAPT